MSHLHNQKFTLSPPTFIIYISVTSPPTPTTEAVDGGNTAAIKNMTTITTKTRMKTKTSTSTTSASTTNTAISSALLGECHDCRTVSLSDVLGGGGGALSAEYSVVVLVVVAEVTAAILIGDQCRDLLNTTTT